MDDRLGIVVGVDGSQGSVRAARWAASEAQQLRLPLHVVHFWSPTVAEVPIAPRAAEDDQRRPPALLDRALAEIRGGHRDLHVETRVVEDRAVHGLLSLSEAADMIVVGSHGGGGFLGMPIGSVAGAVASHASCPTVVVRPTTWPREGAAVIVAVDGSEANQPALGYAFHRASVCQVPLEAVLCWRVGYGDLQTEQAAEARLADALEPWREKHPEVHLQRHVCFQAARPGLIAASRNASLIVVGSRGYGGFRGLLLGSVSSALVQHAECPVAVVRSQHLDS
jgi:nucleotide-binding universal stress UspA family protein